MLSFIPFLLPLAHQSSPQQSAREIRPGVGFRLITKRSGSGIIWCWATSEWSQIIHFRAAHCSHFWVYVDGFSLHWDPGTAVWSGTHSTALIWIKLASGNLSLQYFLLLCQGIIWLFNALVNNNWTQVEEETIGQADLNSHITKYHNQEWFLWGGLRKKGLANRFGKFLSPFPTLRFINDTLIAHSRSQEDICAFISAPCCSFFACTKQVWKFGRVLCFPLQKMHTQDG